MSDRKLSERVRLALDGPGPLRRDAYPVGTTISLHCATCGFDWTMTISPHGGMFDPHNPQEGPIAPLTPTDRELFSDILLGGGPCPECILSEGAPDG